MREEGLSHSWLNVDLPFETQSAVGQLQTHTSSHKLENSCTESVLGLPLWFADVNAIAWPYCLEIACSAKITIRCMRLAFTLALTRNLVKHTLTKSEFGTRIPCDINVPLLKHTRMSLTTYSNRGSTICVYAVTHQQLNPGVEASLQATSKIKVITTYFHAQTA